MHHLNEPTRRAYLQAMGISQWYSRSDLPGAGILAWPSTNESDSDELASNQSASQTAASLKAMIGTAVDESGTDSDVTAGGTDADSPTAQISSASSVDAPASAPQPARQSAEKRGRSVNVEFIQRWWAKSGWCLIDTRANNVPVDQQKACDRLMLALAQTVCGARDPAVSHRIDWPLFVNRSIRHDLSEAQFYLAQKWEAVQQQGPITHLLLLGELTPDLLQKQLEKTPGLNVLYGPGTVELMHLPGKKRQFWQQLRQWMKQ